MKKCPQTRIKKKQKIKKIKYLYYMATPINLFIIILFKMKILFLAENRKIRI